MYTSNAEIHKHLALRACVVNHRTSEAAVIEIVSEVLAAADEVLSRETDPIG